MTRWYQVKGSLIGMTLSATDNEVVEAEAGSRTAFHPYLDRACAASSFKRFPICQHQPL
jgi:hypothetical protein